MLVERVRPGIGRSELQSVRKALANLKLKRIVIRNALRLVQHRIHVIADIGHADGRVAGILAGGDRLGAEIYVVSVRVVISAAVGIDLPVHGVLRGGEQRLVERNRQDLVLAVIADVAGAEQPVLDLVLQIESPVFRVRQLVVDVVAAEHEWAERVAGGILARYGLGDIGQQGRERGRASGGRGRRSGSKGTRQGGAAGREFGRNKGRRQRDAEGSVEAGAGGRRKIAEEFAAVVIDAESGCAR